MKRVFYFVATNLLLLGVVLSIVGLEGRSTGGALVMAGIFGMGGSFISMAMPKWVARRSTGGRVLDNPITPTDAGWWKPWGARPKRRASACRRWR